MMVVALIIMMIMVTKITKEHTIIVNILSLKIARLTKNQQIWAWKDWGNGACLGHHLSLWGMSGTSSGACLGYNLGHWCIIWGMSGASSRACLGHHLGHVWGIILGMSGATSEGMSGASSEGMSGPYPWCYMHLWCRFYLMLDGFHQTAKASMCQHHLKVNGCIGAGMNHEVRCLWVLECAVQILGSRRTFRFWWARTSCCGSQGIVSKLGGGWSRSPSHLINNWHQRCTADIFNGCSSGLLPVH